MIVYLVLQGTDYEGVSVLEVCSTYEKAIEVINDEKQTRRGEWVVDSTKTNTWRRMWSGEPSYDYLAVREREVK